MNDNAKNSEDGAIVAQNYLKGWFLDIGLLKPYDWLIKFDSTRRSNVILADIVP